MNISIDCGDPSGALCFIKDGIYHYVKLPNDFKELHLILNMLNPSKLIIEDVSYIANVAQKNKLKLLESYFRSIFCAESLGIEIIKLSP